MGYFTKCCFTTIAPLPASFPDSEINNLALYKIVPENYSLPFSSKGSILLRYLKDYQTIECDKRRDVGEGNYAFSVSDLPGQSQVGYARRYLEESWGLKLPDGDVDSSAMLFDCQVNFQAPESLVYCLTGWPTEKLLQKFGESVRDRSGKVISTTPGRAYRINDLLKFKQLLDLSICSDFQCQPSVLQPVHYRHRYGPDLPERIGFHPAFVKDPEFAEEYEWRFVWSIDKQLPKDKKGPFLYSISELSRCVDHVSRKSIRQGVHVTVADGDPEVRKLKNRKLTVVCFG